VNNESLPENLRVGLFEENREYKTILRYSSNNQDPHHEDAKGDIRGLGIKVLNAKGIPGVSQDFLFLGIDTVFIPNNTFYVEFLERLLRDNQFKVVLWFAAKHPKLAYIMLKGFANVGRYFNPKDIPFFSAVALRLGDRTLKDGSENFNRRAVKYKLQEVACNPGQKPKFASKKDTDVKDPDYLSKNFEKSLAESEVCLSLSILIRDQKDKEIYPVEDATIAWKGEYHPVADIRLRQQSIHTPQRSEFCENLRFSPWNTLSEHRPLGRINRARKEIYEAVAVYRNQRNGISDYREPVDF
jgi:catalase